MNIVQQIRSETRPFSRQPAVIDGDRCVSYAELLEAVDTTREQLADLGIAAGMRVAFRCEDGLDFIVCSLALLDLGAAIVPLSTNLTGPEMAQALERIRVHAFLFTADSVEADPGDTAAVLSACAAAFGLRTRAGPQSSPPGYGALNAAFIRFSSGTTAASKGVVLSHETILARTAAANRGLAISERDTVLWVLPMSHHFVVSILLFLRRAATLVIAHRDFPAALLAGGGRDDITVIYASPVHYEILVRAPAVPGAAFRAVRLALSTAMKLPRHTAVAAAAKFGLELAEAYGIIEVGLPFVNLRPDVDSRASVGQLLPDYGLRIADPDAAGVGHLLIRGKGLFDAYFCPWQTRRQCCPDGWFRTGDLGCLDADGNLHIVGRRKTVIVFAGMKVFPQEVEEVINADPGVVESLVYGAAHPHYGHVPRAKIVLCPDATDRDAVLKRIRKRCYAALASHKVPAAFAIVPELAKTHSGKLVRH